VPGPLPVDTISKSIEGFTEGGSAAFYIGGSFSTYAGWQAVSLARFGCPRPAVSITQAGGSGTCSVICSGLVPGRETFNVFSVEPCPGSPGSGPFLGLCASDVGSLYAQALLPLESPPFHFTASSSSMAFGPFVVPPLVVDALAADVDPVFGLRWSPVVRVSIQ
jgi:hypothetical protein